MWMPPLRSRPSLTLSVSLSLLGIIPGYAVTLHMHRRVTASVIRSRLRIRLFMFSLFHQHLPDLMRKGGTELDAIAYSFSDPCSAVTAFRESSTLTFSAIRS